VDPAGIPALLDAIRHVHGCEARWVESVRVHETHEGKIVWDGEVQVFVLVGHPLAAPCAQPGAIAVRRCEAWG